MDWNEMEGQVWLGDSGALGLFLLPVLLQQGAAVCGWAVIVP